MPFANPRRRHHRKNRHRHHRARHNFPLLWNAHRRRRHRNPGSAVGGATLLIRHPKDLVMGGAVGAVAAFGAIAFPNSFLPYPGTDLTSRVIRLASRAAAGGLIYMLVKRVLPRYGQDALMGATIAVGGGAVLDFLGITLAIGKGDTVLMPGQLIPTGFNMASLGFPSGGAVAGYTRPMGALAMPRGGTLGAYSHPQTSFRGIHGPGSFGLSPMGDRLYGG
jgi:hypothetical protein